MNVCIVHPNRASYSETFIHNHIKKLPARVSVLYGGWFPTRIEPKSRLIPLPLDILGRFRAKLPNPVNSANDFARRLLLQRFLRQMRIELVLAEYGPTGAAVMPACVRSGIPFVVHFHGFDAYDHPTLDEYADQYRRTFEKCAAIIAVSRDMRRQLLDLGAPADKTFYVSYGVDCSLFTEAEPGKAQPVFLAVARFVDKKAPHLTLLAFHKVLAAVPDAKLVMIGDGDLLEASRRIAMSLGMQGSVEFRGACSPVEVAEATKNARAFVQHSVKTSFGDSEGTPNTILEAGAAGLPVVSTRHGGIKDVVQEGETGFLVDEGDVDGMAAHMIRLAKEPDLAATMGHAAREHMLSQFSLSGKIEELWNILQMAAGTAAR